MSSISQVSWLHHKRHTAGSYGERSDAMSALKELSSGQVCPPPAPLERSSVSAKLYPNGEFGIGYVSREKKNVREQKQDRGIVHDYQTFWEGHPHFLPSGEILFDPTDMVVLIEPKLDITPESSQPPTRYGLKGITSYGRRCVRNIGYLIQEEYGKRRLSMGTLTIPSLDPEEMRCIARHWNDIQRKFFQECKRRYDRLKLPWRYVAVTEIQPKRWKEYGEVGLHIHFLFPSFRLYKRGMFSLPYDWTRKTWQRIIENTLKQHSVLMGDDHSVPLPMYNCQQVKKDAVGYLAKYLSKGCDIIDEVREQAGEEFLPRQWWSADSNSKKELKNKIIASTGSMAEFLLYICNHGDDSRLISCKAATIPSYRLRSPDGAPIPITIGYGGRVNMSTYRELSRLQRKHG